MFVIDGEPTIPQGGEEIVPSSCGTVAKPDRFEVCVLTVRCVRFEVNVSRSKRKEPGKSGSVLSSHVCVHVGYSCGSSLSYHGPRKANPVYWHSCFHLCMSHHPSTQFSTLSSLVPLPPTVFACTVFMPTVTFFMRPARSSSYVPPMWRSSAPSGR